jgi:hypothetical protein
MRFTLPKEIQITYTTRRETTESYVCYFPEGQPIVWAFKDGRIELEMEGKIVRLDTTDYAVLFDAAPKFPASPKPRLLRLIDSLPQRFRWTPHNLIAHPLSEVLFQLGFEELGNKLHDITVPTHEKGTGRG